MTDMERIEKMIRDIAEWCDAHGSISESHWRLYAELVRARSSIAANVAYMDRQASDKKLEAYTIEFQEYMRKAEALCAGKDDRIIELEEAIRELKSVAVGLNAVDLDYMREVLERVGVR